MPSALHLATESSTDLPLHRVRRISAAMVWACRSLMVLMPLALAAYWAWADVDQLAASAQLAPSLVIGPLEPWQRWAGGLAMALPLGLLLAGVARAKRCFQQFALGDVFTAEATALLRGFAGWVAAAALGAIVATSVASVVLTLNNPPGLRHLAVAISSNHVFTLFFAATVWLMAAVIGQGQALVEENKGFV